MFCILRLSVRRQQCFESTSFFNNNSYTMVPKMKKSDTEIKKGVGGFQKPHVIFWGGMSKYLLLLTGVSRWVVWKRPKTPYVI